MPFDFWFKIQVNKTCLTLFENLSKSNRPNFFSLKIIHEEDAITNRKKYMMKTLFECHLKWRLEPDKYLCNRLFFFERCSLITATMCAYKLKNARYRGMKICCTHRCSYETISFKEEQFIFFIFTFSKPFFQRIFNFLK